MTLFLGGQECICWHCHHQSLNHPEHESEMHSFVSLLESWEVMLVEETRDKARCFGPIVPGYEAYCIPLNSLHLVDVLLEVRVPDDSSVVQK